MKQKNYAEQEHRALFIKHKHYISQIKTKNITYINYCGFRTSIHQIDGSVEVCTRKSLIDCENNLLDCHFIRINRNVIINALNIKEINTEQNHIVLLTDEIFTITRRRKSKIYEKLL